jgi:signal transduction histidine kinase
MQRGRVDLTALLKNVAEKFIPLARSAGVAIYVESGTLPDISGDGDRLAQVFTNLIDNALKFTPPGGRIALRAARLATGIQIEVADSGAGIPENALPHIFDRFYQVDPSRTGGRRHGAGLGLAIVKEIVAAHGGTLSVRSRLGAGTTFTVLLPLSSTAATTIVSRRKK